MARDTYLRPFGESVQSYSVNIMDLRPKSSSRLKILVFFLMGSFAVPGCIQRRMTICSNPPGALVRVDDVEIGTTPVSTSFVYYGTRKVQLSKPGYETITILQPVRTPWYQWPGIDFFSEHFAPGKIHDDRQFSYNLQPAQAVPTDQLLERAEQLREEADVLNPTEAISGGQLPTTVVPLPTPPPSQPSFDPRSLPADGRLPF